MGKARSRIKLFVLAAGLMVALASAAVFFCTQMPGESHDAALPLATETQERTAERIGRHVERLSDIGPRNMDEARALERAAHMIERAWRRQGYEVRAEAVEAGGETAHNLFVELPGGSTADEWIIIGAHYDTAVGTPGANDNASGVAALLELSRRFADQSFPRSVRLIAFVNEEPPHFQTDAMGSVIHAQGVVQRGERVAGMLSLETLGYYSSEPGSQSYPPGVSLLYPDRGDFVAFVGELGSARFVRECTRLFRAGARFPSAGIAAPDFIPGIGWSDHWSFSQRGFPAAMVTDTAPFRYPHYHLAGDRADQVDALAIARVVDGLEYAVAALAGEPRD